MLITPSKNSNTLEQQQQALLAFAIMFTTMSTDALLCYNIFKVEKKI